MPRKRAKTKQKSLRTSSHKSDAVSILYSPYLVLFFKFTYKSSLGYILTKSKTKIIKMLFTLFSDVRIRTTLSKSVHLHSRTGRKNG